MALRSHRTPATLVVHTQTVANTLNTNTWGVSIHQVCVCVYVYYLVHLYACSPDREWGWGKRIAVCWSVLWQRSAEIGVSMCAFECDSGHYYGVAIVCVCTWEIRMGLRLINIVSKLSLLTVFAGSSDGEDWTEQWKLQMTQVVCFHTCSSICFYNLSLFS